MEKDILEITFGENKRVNAHINGHVIPTDQPLDNGGDNSAPSPFDLFLASIGTCAGIYVKSFCDKREIPTTGISLFQEAIYNESTGLPDQINIEVRLPEDFPARYHDPVINAASLCKVKRTFIKAPEFGISISAK